MGCCCGPPAAPPRIPGSSAGCSPWPRWRYFQRGSFSLDPVVTGARDRLRFPAGMDGEMPGHGTTNVDVNAPLRQALARVGGGDPLHVAVGPAALEVSTVDDSVTERKVPLPPRWLRVTSRPVAGAVCLPGSGRLAALRPFLRFATTVRAYGPAVRLGDRPVASTWDLTTPEPCRRGGRSWH